MYLNKKLLFKKLLYGFKNYKFHVYATIWKRESSGLSEIIHHTRRAIITLARLKAPKVYRNNSGNHVKEAGKLLVYSQSRNAKRSRTNGQANLHSDW